MESEVLKAKDDQIRSLQAQLLDQNRQSKGNFFQTVKDVVRNSSLTEREDELADGFKRKTILQRKLKEKGNLSKQCEQLFCCMVGKWHRHYICPVEEDLEELSKVSLGVRSISYYRSWTSQEMAAELEKGLDACGGYCLCMKSGKFLKHVQSTVPDGKSLKGLFPKMVYIVPMQKDIEGMVDTNYNTEMIHGNYIVFCSFDETRPSFDGVKTILQPKVSMTSQESHKKFVSQENSMEIEAFVDSNAVEMSPQSNVNITDDKSAPSEKQHVPAAVNSIIHASSHLPYGRHVHITKQVVHQPRLSQDIALKAIDQHQGQFVMSIALQGVRTQEKDHEAEKL
ncbi:hypothetical protein OUZ56_012804 [Daphnia magna]|uniref:Uncharacterized protein n=1 Tax=Daphnia magna TaxID=35525 RepID=A0ABQ9Z437_9CRUS|nr:hypothetical protein OUZ56_012804 [Daphnia magna]